MEVEGVAPGGLVAGRDQRLVAAPGKLAPGDLGDRSQRRVACRRSSATEGWVAIRSSDLRRALADIGAAAEHEADRQLVEPVQQIEQKFERRLVTPVQVIDRHQRRGALGWRRRSRVKIACEIGRPSAGSPATVTGMARPRAGGPARARRPGRPLALRAVARPAGDRRSWRGDAEGQVALELGAGGPEHAQPARPARDREPPRAAASCPSRRGPRSAAPAPRRAVRGRYDLRRLRAGTLSLSQVGTPADRSSAPVTHVSRHTSTTSLLPRKSVFWTGGSIGANPRVAPWGEIARARGCCGADQPFRQRQPLDRARVGPDQRVCDGRRRPGAAQVQWLGRAGRGDRGRRLRRAGGAGAETLGSMPGASSGGRSYLLEVVGGSRGRRLGEPVGASGAGATGARKRMRDGSARTPTRPLSPCGSCVAPVQ